MAHVLVVDDDAEQRSALRCMLEGAGHTVDEAADGHAAELADRERTADVVVLDVHMPHRDGLETLRSFRNRGRPAKVIMIGGAFPLCQIDYLPIAQRLGADATLRKPLARDDLLRAVETLLKVANTH